MPRSPNTHRSNTPRRSRVTPAPTCTTATPTVVIERGVPTVVIEAPPPGQPPRIRKPPPRRLGHHGPGVPTWSQRGKPDRRRESWILMLMAASLVTAKAKEIGAYLARFGDPDGSHIWPSQARVAKELSVSTGTVSRAVCELEDAGWLLIQRWRPSRCSDGRWWRRHTNVYNLSTPPQGLEGGSRRLRRRSGLSPHASAEASDQRRSAVEAAVAEAERILDEGARATSRALSEFDVRTVAALRAQQAPGSQPTLPEMAPEVPESDSRALKALARLEQAWRARQGRRDPPQPQR